MKSKHPGALLPTDELIKLLTQAALQEIFAYHQRLESINFRTVITRPDILNTESKLLKFLTNPSNQHIAFANHAILFFSNTKDYLIESDRRVFDFWQVFWPVLMRCLIITVTIVRALRDIHSSYKMKSSIEKPLSRRQSALVLPRQSY